MSQTLEAQAFISRISCLPPGPGAFNALSDALQASLDDEATLRKLFASEKANPRLNDPYVGLVDVFSASDDIRTTRARVVQDEHDLSAKFILPLATNRRRKEGAPAIVTNLDEFRKNWAIFTEGSLSQLLDWNNVVAAGGSVQACLNPLPESAKVSKRAVRKHYHTNAFPTSDIDLFLYGMTPQQAEAKINAIYEAVRDSVPWDVTCVRTKHTISIHSQYPYRAVQIVLRLYSSPAEILAGFDVDAPCCAYDGQRVWASPRAIVAMMRQCNTVDMTRRSPSYEVRLAKYSSRDFEVYVPSLKREDVDPTIYERSIARMHGLARLLVLERLTDSVSRQNYLEARRALRGRPESQKSWKRWSKKYKGDLKADVDFAGLEMNDYDVSSLHIPYGPGWDARRIEKLIYQTDLGMNSPFNPKNKGRRLHRHPAFFGTMAECLEDCCEFCPEPKGDDERKLQEHEGEMYLKGRVQFIQEDPGRQSISGSFKPIDIGEWAEQAYVGAMEKLFNAIATWDRATVETLIEQDSACMDRRDHVGRTPLQVAILSRAVDISCILIDAGARITARVADGRTALHLAAQESLPDVVHKLLQRSAVNAEKAKEAQEKAEQESVKEQEKSDIMDVDDEQDEDASDRDDDSEEGWVVEDGDDHSRKDIQALADVDDGQILDNEDEPDILDVNATDWDLAFTPLQYAIISGSLDVVSQLIAAGADVTLMTKSNRWDSHQLDHLTVLGLVEHDTVASKLAEKLIAAGAVSSKADEDLYTIFHRLVRFGKPNLVKTVLRCDAGAKAVVNMPFMISMAKTVYPVVSAINGGDYSIIALLLAYGAKLVFTREDFGRMVDLRKPPHWWKRDDVDAYLENVFMPVEVAIQRRDDVVTLLVALGADAHLPVMDGREIARDHQRQRTLVDWVNSMSKEIAGKLEKHVGDQDDELASDQKTVIPQSGWKGEACKSTLQYLENRKKEQSEIASNAAEQRGRWMRETQQYLTMLEQLLSSHGAKSGYEGSAEKAEAVQPQKTVAQPYAGLQYKRMQERYNESASTHVLALYDELFDACSLGDNSKIQDLCLPKPGNKSHESLLQIAAQFGSNAGLACTTLSLALSGRHWDTARLILAIASAQHQPEQNQVVKFQTKDIALEEDDDSHEDEDEDMSSDDDEPLDFVDIAKRPSAVQTRASPKDLLDAPILWLVDDGKQTQFWPVLDRAIVQDDFEAFVQIADMYNGLAQPFPETMAIWIVMTHDRVAMLDELIRRFGVGIDVDTKENGSDGRPDALPEHTKMYVGLNVHGKKRKDLAMKGDSNAPRTVKSTSMPLLWTAVRANAEEVMKYLAGDRPLAAYQYYASTHSDERAQFLRRVPDIEIALAHQLGWRMNDLSESAVTAAVIKGRLDNLRILTSLRPKEVQDAIPANINFCGFNHLFVAAHWGASPELFDYLIEKGVSPVAVDHLGQNILHVLCGQNGQQHLRLLQHVLHRLPKDVVEHLLMQQSKCGQSTPLSNAVQCGRLDMVRLLITFKASACLLRNIEGSTVLHIAVRSGRANLTKALVDAGPSEALYMEDGVGSTPLEIARLRDLLHRTGRGLKCNKETPLSMGQMVDFYVNEEAFDVAKQEIQIPRLRATVEELLKEGRLQAGTKMATELLRFTDTMEEKLTKTKAEVEAQAVAETDDGKNVAVDELQMELDTTDNVAETLEHLKRALSTRPISRPRLLVHLLDVHKSVENSLEGSVQDNAERLQKRKEELEPEAEEDQNENRRRSIMDLWHPN